MAIVHRILSFTRYEKDAKEATILLRNPCFSSGQVLQMGKGYTMEIHGVYVNKGNENVIIQIAGKENPIELDGIPPHCWLNLINPVRIAQLVNFKILGQCKLSVKIEGAE